MLIMRIIHTTTAVIYNQQININITYLLVFQNNNEVINNSKEKFPILNNCVNCIIKTYEHNKINIYIPQDWGLLYRNYENVR